jgi:AhpC/TSA family/Disulphide bond corrector protein DsbC
LENSRAVLEQNGIRVAAASYDSEKVLKKFSDEHRIGYALLSDTDSAVIRSFGILNTNIAPDMRSYGVPHPVEYLVATDGAVLKKYFVPNYQHRVSGSEVALLELGVAASAGATRLTSGPLKVEVVLSSGRAFAGQRLGIRAAFELEPGWHIYGQPVPPSYTPAAIRFDNANVIEQSFEFPKPRLANLGRPDGTLPVYEGKFEALGKLLLKFPIDAGGMDLAGTLGFQLCSDTVCEAPDSLKFKLPLVIEPFMVPKPGR